MPIREGGKSSPSLSLAPPLDCQNVARFQARHPESIVERNARLSWFWVFVVGIVCACVCAAAVIVSYGR